MRTELVPYQLVTRVSIRSTRDREHVGFDLEHAPNVLEAHGALTPGAALRRAAPATPTGGEARSSSSPPAAGRSLGGPVDDGRDQAAAPARSPRRSPIPAVMVAKASRAAPA